MAGMVGGGGEGRGAEKGPSTLEFNTATRPKFDRRHCTISKSTREFLK